MDLWSYAWQVSDANTFFAANELILNISTLTSSSGVKTRNFATIVSELTDCIQIHMKHGSSLNGVSLEFTGELADDGFSVTECLGGSMELGEDQLSLRYQVNFNTLYCTNLLSGLHRHFVILV